MLPSSHVQALGSVVVEIEADDGTTGVGVSIGGEPACFIVEKHLSRFVEGQDPRCVFVFDHVDVLSSIVTSSSSGTRCFG
jgi:hypothetical protein